MAGPGRRGGAAFEPLRTGIDNYWIPPARAAEIYLRVQRPDDAVAAVHSGFSASPGVASWQQLLQVGRAVGTESEQRVWGIGEAERLAAQPFGSGASLVEIALDEDRLDDAWSAAKWFGPAMHGRP